VVVFTPMPNVRFPTGFAIASHVTDGGAQVESPRQNVFAVAPVPELRLPTGRFPLTSVARLTDPKVGGPPEFPWRTVVDDPRVPRTLMSVVPFPITSWFAVRFPAVLVTVPAPAGVAQLPSPRQKVEDEAESPEFRFPTGRFPITPPLADEARLICGMSALTRPRHVGRFAAPDVGPANTQFALCEVVVKTICGVVVGLFTAAVKNGVEPLTLTTDTVPEAEGGTAQVASPRQKVVALAPVPLFRLVVERLPVTSVARFTELKDGGAPPCRTVVAVPVEPSVARAWLPCPITI
jgi:hypothetical protein